MTIFDLDIISFVFNLKLPCIYLHIIFKSYNSEAELINYPKAS